MRIGGGRTATGMLGGDRAGACGVCGVACSCCTVDPCVIEDAPCRVRSGMDEEGFAIGPTVDGRIVSENSLSSKHFHVTH